VIESDNEIARRIAAQRQARSQSMTQWECKQINRQLRIEQQVEKTGTEESQA